MLGWVEEVFGVFDCLCWVVVLFVGGLELWVILVLFDIYYLVCYEVCLVELDECYFELEFECLIVED